MCLQLNEWGLSILVNVAQKAKERNELVRARQIPKSACRKRETTYKKQIGNKMQICRCLISMSFSNLMKLEQGKNLRQ
jgi:hypothetical protein